MELPQNRMFEIDSIKAKQLIGEEEKKLTMMKSNCIHFSSIFIPYFFLAERLNLQISGRGMALKHTDSREPMTIISIHILNQEQHTFTVKETDDKYQVLLTTTPFLFQVAPLAIDCGTPNGEALFPKALGRQLNLSTNHGSSRFSIHAGVKWETSYF
ncbi:hypothetical protein JTE90_006450 [Oedothorax gibbosus]|uniref:Uncharacterized protein n=1 Tax=Oedothorax gibbosus TaxID=931172 RepID=A0AAV6UHU4_9ARAC|nr:hypothetical protein JTE90_006450 [Oedothorax gibbosus]